GVRGTYPRVRLRAAMSLLLSVVVAVLGVFVVARAFSASGPTVGMCLAAVIAAIVSWNIAISLLFGFIFLGGHHLPLSCLLVSCISGLSTRIPLYCSSQIL